MSIAMTIMYAAAMLAQGSQHSQSGEFDCEINRPDGPVFELTGSFDESSISSNLAEFVEENSLDMNGEQQSLIVNSGGTRHHRWQSAFGFGDFDHRYVLILSEYGTQTAAAEILREVPGRHVGTVLIGVGFCTIDHSASEEMPS